MIRFFRTIRQNLLAEGKTYKYLKYAIGEIILVVIGILIALNINNWNENRKTFIKITNSLTALRDDLIQDNLSINENLKEVKNQYELNESLRKRIAQPKATIDTLVKIARHEFNPNWNDQIFYHTNAYNSLNTTGLIEELPDSLKAQIKNFYNGKFNRTERVEKITTDYRNKLADYVGTYTFGSTSIHDQGRLIDSLVWANFSPNDLAAKFQGISNFKRLLFTLSKDEMEYSLKISNNLINQIDIYLNNQ